MILLLSVAPILILICLLLILRVPLVKAAPIGLLTALILSTQVWNLPVAAVFSILMKGTLLTIDIALIVFGAISFIEFLKQSDAFESLRDQLNLLTNQRPVQVIMIAWLFGSFIEGVSGFGTSAVIVAPFLVSIGIRKRDAIIISLVANSTAVTFGAVGTPIRIGLSDFVSSGLNTTVANAHLMAGLVVPFLILYFIMRLEDQPWAKFLKAIPWTVFLGFCFLVPYAFSAHLGPDYPSIAGGTLGLILAVLVLHSGFIKSKGSLKKSSLLDLTRAFKPYLLLLLILIVGKVLFKNWTVLFELGHGLKHNLQVFNPGMAFITTMAFMTLLQSKTSKGFFHSLNLASKMLFKVSLTIFCISSMTYAMVLTDMNPLTTGMLETISNQILGPFLSYYAVFIGAFGAFLAGSATVSNLLFGQVLAQAAQNYDLSLTAVLALQVSGAAIGNMIALTNIIAVQAAVGEENTERELLMVLFLPCMIYLVLVSIVINSWL